MLNRRKFLQQSSLAGLAATIPSFLFACQKKKLGVALVGLGYYSRDLLAPALTLTKHCELKGIVSSNPDKIKTWQQKYGIKDSNVYNYNNMHTIVNNPEIDIVYIVLPTSLHAKYSIIAANAGKHVWCEKSMAKTAAECQSIINACRDNKVQLTIGYRMHHESNTQKIMAYAKTKPFGKIQKIKAEAGFYASGSNGSWRQKKSMGGGAMYDMGVYCLNAARYVTGEEPIAVTARQYSNRPSFADVDETTEFTLEFPSGAIAECKSSFGENMNHLHVTCENGWYELKPFQSYSGVQGRASDGTIFPPDPNNQQARQMDDDALAILHNKAVLAPGEEGLKDVRIIEAIFQSAASGKRVTLS